ncbi:MAG TPA: phosphatase PAP2 family protein [Chryseolinea sp.]|nr:phosphatase PAP2 family protein [Chryseolinea sp.]
MVNLLAKIVSFLFHPLLLATYMFGLFTFSLPAGLDPLKEDGHLNFVFLIFCVTFLLPALNIGIFKTFGSIKSLAMEERQERIIPFTFIAILYSAITYLFYSRTRVSFNDNLLKFLLIIDVLVIIATLVTIFYKVSVHSMSIWAFIGIILPLNKLSEDGALFYPTLALIVIAGLVMTARLQLNAHTPREVLVGGMLGFAISFAAMVVLF